MRVSSCRPNRLLPIDEAQTKRDNPPQVARFPSTRLSLVRIACPDSSYESRQALATLCRLYWYPLYAFVRREGHNPDDAQDLTQAFFARLLFTVLDRVISRLQAEFAESGKGAQFERMKPLLAGDETRVPYADLASEVNTTEGALKTAIHRLRRRYRKILRDEIAQTVGHPDEVQKKIRYLVCVLT